jgi:hypothetical protein
MIKRSMSWGECEAVAVVVWGEHAWQHEFTKRCRVTPRTIARWRAADQVQGPVVTMLDAFMRLRRYGMTLPKEEGLAP